MRSFNTLTEALDVRLADDVAITYIGGESNERSVSLPILYQRALGILRHLQGRGLGPGDQLILWVGSDEQFVDGFWACLLGGIVPVPLALGITDDHRLKVLRVGGKLRNPFLYTDRKSLGRLQSFARTQGLAAAFDLMRPRTILADEIDDISRSGDPYRSAPSDTAFIQFSSGSTSEPKGVVLTHRNLMVNIDAIIASSAMTAADSFLSWMPLTHDMGLIGFHLTPLVLGVNQFLMATELFVRRPLLWLQKASEKRATITCSPNFGYKHLLRAFSSEKAAGVDLAPVRLIFNGAEPVALDLCNEFCAKLDPFGLKRTAMYPVYGLAEASLAVTFPDPGARVQSVAVDRRVLGVGAHVRFVDAASGNRAIFVSVGRAIRDCELRLVDERGAVLGDKVVGHIQIRGGNVTAGYYGDEEATRAVLGPDGWLDTGDLGFMLDGRLVITGRTKDILFVNGQNFFPHDLEAVAVSGGYVDLGKVAACGVRREGDATDEVLVFVLHRGPVGDFIPMARAIKTHISEQVGVEVAHVIPVTRIPKTTSGKIQRYLLGEEYLLGEHAEILRHTERLLATHEEAMAGGPTAVERTLLEICDSVMMGKKVGLHDNLFEIGTSSLILAQIYERMEKVFPGRVDIQDLFEHPTIADLAAHLQGGLVS